MSLATEPTQGSLPEKRDVVVIYNKADRIFRRIVTGGALTSLALLGAIGFFLIYRSAEIFKDFGLTFITGSEWIIGTDGTSEGASFGLGPMLVGSIVVALIALVIAVPLSIGGALYIEFYSPLRLRRVLVTLLDLAAAIPSVIFGLWGIEVFADIGSRWSVFLNDWFGWFPLFSVEFENFGRSPFIAGCVLASLIVPITTSIAREVYSRTPRDLVDTCYALGSTKWGAIKTVVLPYGKSGVIGGAMLGLGRALGETIAVFLLLNLAFDYDFRILESVGGNIASHIASKFSEAGEYELKALIAAGFVLFCLTLIVNMIASVIVQRSTSKK
jgi:phosphate transport system permease protein